MRFFQVKKRERSDSSALAANPMQVSLHVHNRSNGARKFAESFTKFGKISNSHLNFVQIH